MKALLLLLACASSALAAPIDYATTLRLAGAKSVDVALARNALHEAQAKQAEIHNRFFPWLQVGAVYHRSDGKTQDAPGNIIETSKQNYQVGPGVVAELKLGETIYQNLAAKQRSRAAAHMVDSATHDVVNQASGLYFDLLRAQAALRIEESATKLSNDYRDQVKAAVGGGVAFEGDQYRAEAQTLRHDLSRRKALEDVQLASARLSELLRLPNGMDLRGVDSELVPLHLSDADEPLSEHVSHALDKRPELLGHEALLEAARIDTEAGHKAPLYPDLSLTARAGGLGGGQNGDTGNFGGNSEVTFGLGWRIGPGGLFDSARIKSAEAKEEEERLLIEKARQHVTREVLEAIIRVRSLNSRIATTRQLLDVSEKAYTFSLQRGNVGVGGVLETLRSEEDYDFARLAYFDLITQYNKAQAELRRARGD